MHEYDFIILFEYKNAQKIIKSYEQCLLEVLPLIFKCFDKLYHKDTFLTIYLSFGTMSSHQNKLH